MSSIKGGRAIGIGMALFVGVGTAWLAVESHRDDTEVARQSLAARAVSTLPPGVEEAWLAYVDEQFTRLIIRRGDTLELSGPTMIVSINMPFSISCDPMNGTKVTFGSGETAASIEIIGLMMQKPLFQQLPGHVLSMDDAEPVPNLPVDVESVAAHTLASELCERISQRIQTLVRPHVTP